MQDHFEGEPSSHWTRWLQGAGRLEPGGSTIRLVTQDARAGDYSDAQLDDYHGLPRRKWPWQPPLKMQVRARASHSSLVGTAGFGFWNDPFTLTGGINALPEAVWFFYASPPSDMALVPGVPGWGWKAAIVHAARVVRDLNFKYLHAGKGAPVTARFGRDGITIVDPIAAGKGKAFRRIYRKPL